MTGNTLSLAKGKAYAIEWCSDIASLAFESTPGTNAGLHDLLTWDLRSARNCGRVLIQALLQPQSFFFLVGASLDTFIAVVELYWISGGRNSAILRSLDERTGRIHANFPRKR